MLFFERKPVILIFISVYNLQTHLKMPTNSRMNTIDGTLKLYTLLLCHIFSPESSLTLAVLVVHIFVN